MELPSSLQVFNRVFAQVWVNRPCRSSVLLTSPDSALAQLRSPYNQFLADPTSHPDNLWLRAIRGNPDPVTNLSAYREVTEGVVVLSADRNPLQPWAETERRLQRNDTDPTVPIVYMPRAQDPAVMANLLGWSEDTVRQVGTDVGTRVLADKMNKLARNREVAGTIYIYADADVAWRELFLQNLVRVYDTLPVLALD